MNTMSRFMKPIFFGIIGIKLIASADPIVSDVTAKQRYPWNGMVDIDYTITGDATGMSLEVSVEDVQNGKTYTPTKFLSLLPVSEGLHRIIWSTEAEGVRIFSTTATMSAWRRRRFAPNS